MNDLRSEGLSKESEIAKVSRGPLLVYIMLALIVGLVILFLVLRPRGSTGGTNKSFVAPLRLERLAASPRQAI